MAKRREGQPLDQPVPRVFHQILAVLTAKDPMKGSMDAGLGLVKQHVGQHPGTVVAEVVPLGVRVPSTTGGR